MTDSLLGVIQKLQTRINELAQRTPSAPIWAVVASVSPLLVTPETQSEPIPAAAKNGAGNLKVGAKVLMQRYGSQIYVWGPHADPDPPELPLGQVVRITSLDVPNSNNWQDIGDWQDIGGGSSSEPLGRKGGMGFNSGVFTVPIRGIYTVNGRISFAANAAGTRQLGLKVNGAVTQYMDVRDAVTGNNGTNKETALVLPTHDLLLEPGSTLQLVMFQNSGVTLAANSMIFTVRYVQAP